MTGAWPRERGPCWCSGTLPTTTSPGWGRSSLGRGSSASHTVCTWPWLLSPSRRCVLGSISVREELIGGQVTGGTDLPPEIRQIFLLISRQRQQELGQLLGWLIVQHVDVGLGRGFSRVVSTSQHWNDECNVLVSLSQSLTDRNDVQGQRLVELLCHVAGAEGVLEGEIESERRGDGD